MFRKLIYKKMFLNEDVENIIRDLDDPSALKRIFEDLNPIHYKTLYNELLFRLPREKAIFLKEHEWVVIERHSFDFFWEPYMKMPNNIPHHIVAKPEPIKEDFKNLGQELHDKFFSEIK